MVTFRIAFIAGLITMFAKLLLKIKLWFNLFVLSNVFQNLTLSYFMWILNAKDFFLENI